MASHSLNDNTAARSGAPIAAYLDELGARLLGPRRRRAQILAELGDGLNQATDQHLNAGMSAQQSQAAAVAQFGSPEAVADAFEGELATVYARRTIALYVITGPLVGIWWLLLLRPDPWRAGLIALLVAIPVLPLIMLAIATAGGTLASTGRLMRWLPEATPRQALAATAVIAGLCIGGDLTMIALFMASGTPMRPLAIIAVAASMIRIACGTTVIARAALIQAHFP
jgi:hypothetical protein